MMFANILLAAGLFVGLSDSAATPNMSCLSQCYARAFEAVGHRAVVIPITTDTNALREIVRRLDLVVLTGGKDVDPQRYREKGSPRLGAIDRARDAFEFALCDACVREHKPILGICRGVQLLNVYFGGTLYQHLPDDYVPAEGLSRCTHRRWPYDGGATNPPLHGVSIVPGTRLARVLGIAPLQVNSHHHQGIRRLAPGFRVAARADDGLVEAIEHESYPAAGVQFHPENTVAFRPATGFDLERHRRFFGKILDFVGGGKDSAGCVMDLSGDWQVKGDGFAGQARLPGTLAKARLGRRWTERDFQTTMDLPQSEALVQEWQYAGKAVWTRSVELTEADCGKPLELFLERVMWTSTVFWDGVKVGTCDSLATPHVHALPPPVPGRHELRLEIDNGNHYNFSRQSHAYGPNMQAIWNGVLGKVELRRVHPLRDSRVFAAYPANRTLRVEVSEEVSSALQFQLTELAGDSSASVPLRPVDSIPSPHRPGFKLLTLALSEEPKPWDTVKSPVLYELRLREGDYEECIRFGFRTLGIRGHALTLNGNRIFLRGNVENANFAVDGTPWMTKAEWMQMLKTLRDEDGVDTIRFHTWCPPAAAFAAAEELGMFLQPEAGIWTDSWMSDGDEIGNGKPVDDFVRRELRAIVDAYGNSPALLSLAIGNELGNSNFPKMGEMISEVRRHDPRTLYYASSARNLSGADDFLLSHKVLGQGLAREKLLPRTDWDYEERYGASSVPVIAHEIGQWPVYPIWDDLLSPFTGTMRPWNLSRHRDTAAKKNALRFQREYHTASARLNRLIYKEEVESFLRTPSCAGLQLLEVQDYTGQAEALVGWRDPFYGLKAGFRELPPFATVWGPVSYLACIPKFTWQVGETFRAELEIRNLTSRTIPAGTKYVAYLSSDRREFTVASAIAPGEIGKLGVFEMELDQSRTKAKQTLRFGTNRWDFWVYPSEAKRAVPAKVVMTAELATMKAAIAAGKTVLYTGESRHSAKGQFKSVYWSARWFQVANTTAAALGTWFDVTHPALAGFVTEDFTDWQWYSLAEGATIHALRGLPADYRPIALSVNDFHFSDFTSPLFEVFVGTGRLLVCGYDLEADTPEARRLRASIFDYLEQAVAAERMPSALPLAWLDEEFDAAKPPDLSGAVYDCPTNWVGRTFRQEIRGVSPTTGSMVIDFFQPGKNLTSGRGTLDDQVFEVPFTSTQGQKTSVSIPVVREDFLDGKLQLEINVMTGPALGVERIRIVPKCLTDKIGF